MKANCASQPQSVVCLSKENKRQENVRQVEEREKGEAGFVDGCPLPVGGCVVVWWLMKGAEVLGSTLPNFPKL